MISVVMPCYNSSATIFESIDSVIKQTVCCDIEIIVVDDCSSDIEMLEKVLDNIKNENDSISIKLIKNASNKGGGESRNIGIKEANGEYIAFLDSDDVWVEDKLEIQLTGYKSGAVLTSKVYKGKSIESAEILPVYAKKADETISDALFRNSKLIQTSTFFMSSDIANTVMFNPSLPRHQDYDFLLRAEDLGYEIIQTEEALSFWRVEDNSSSRFLKKKASPEFFIDWFKLYRKYMTEEAMFSYVSRNIFSACAITGKLSLFFKFYLSDEFSIAERFKIVSGIISWRFKKLLK